MRTRETIRDDLVHGADLVRRPTLPSYSLVAADGTTLNIEDYEPSEAGRIRDRGRPWIQIWHRRQATMSFYDAFTVMNVSKAESKNVLKQILTAFPI